MKTLVAPLALLLTVTACGPIPLPQAERACLSDARAAAAPTGAVAIGVGTNGPSLGGSISVSSDYLMGRDPSEVYDRCVLARSGQMPSRPYWEVAR